MHRSAFLAALALALVPIGTRADVTLGVMMPSSGKGAAYGKQQQVAIDMFLEKYASLGDRLGKLKLLIEDTRGDNTEAINLTRKLIDSDHVTAIVGPYLSAESEVAFPLAVRGETPIVTPTSAKPGIAAANRPWAFRNALTTDKLDGALVGRWLAAHKQPIKKVVILVDSKDAVTNSDGNAVFPAALKAHGVQVLDTISFQTGDIDFSAQVTRAKSLAPDGIVVVALYNEAGHVVQELRKQGMTQPIVAGLGILDPHFIELGGKAAEGVMTANDFYRESPRPAVAAFDAEFEKRYPEPPTNSAALMYDTLYLMRSCIMAGAGGTDLQADRVHIRDCWAGMKDKEAPLTGPTTINADGDAVRTPVILVVRDGKFTSMK